MKGRFYSVFAIAALVATAACGGDGAEGGEAGAASTVSADTALVQGQDVMTQPAVVPTQDTAVATTTGTMDSAQTGGTMADTTAPKQ